MRIVNDIHVLERSATQRVTQMTLSLANAAFMKPILACAATLTIAAAAGRAAEAAEDASASVLAAVEPAVR